MTEENGAISQMIQAHFYEDDSSEEHPFPASLYYDPQDPAAVVLVMPLVLSTAGQSYGVQEWRFSRDLLVDAALYGQDAGKGGDVFIQPTRSGFRRILLVHLSSHEGHAHILLPLIDVRAFVNRTLAIVGQGHEDYSKQIDAGLRKLLA